MGTHFATINCCNKIYTIGNSYVSEVVRGSSHQLKRLQRVEIAWSLALLVVEGALVMALEMASRLWTMVLAGVTVGMVR